MTERDLDIDWSTQVLRVTLFPAEANAFDSLELETLTGIEAEADEKRPKERFRRQSAPFSDGGLELHVSALRADLFYLPKLTVSASPPELSAFTLPGPFDERLDELLNLVVTPIANMEVLIARLAVGATIVSRFDLLTDAYEAAARCLHSVKVEPEHMHDLLYRINWRVPSQIPDVPYLNRLTTWSVNSAKLLAVNVVSIDQAKLPEHHFIQLELDLNTPVEVGTGIAPEDRTKVLNKLRELACANAKFGEVRHVEGN
jgi:hypothetical protein